MRKLATVFILITLVCLGCKKEAPPPPTPAPKPEPSPEEIAAQIRPILAPAQALVADTGTNQGNADQSQGAAGGLSDDMKEAMKKQLSDARMKYQNTENGRQALAFVTHDIEELISKARDQQRYRTVLGMIEAYEVLAPGSTKMNRLKERARLYVNRPLVRVRGFFDDKETNETYVFLEVELMPSREVHQVKVRKGEEFYGLRFIDFVGDKKGVTLEYLAIPGTFWNVMGP
jgi:hypothetical protein